MKINVYDRCCIRTTTDCVERHNMDFQAWTTFLNKRVLINSGLWWKNARQLKAIDTEWTPSPRGYVKRYACPTCGREMWCTSEDARTPYITCRHCDNSEVGLLYAPENNMFLQVWIGLMEQNYDPLTKGDAYAKNGVADEWLDPVTFCLWARRAAEKYVAKSCVDGCHVWLALRNGAAVWKEDNACVDYGELTHKKFILIK